VIASTNNRDRLPASVAIRHELKPGDIGYLIFLHGILYAKENNLDYTLEAYVAEPLAKFIKSHSARERIWIVETDSGIKGSIAVVEHSKEKAQLRWLLIDPDLRGYGVGRILVEDAVRFCRDSNYSSIFLWTISALKPAAKLYDSVGFELTKEKKHEMWGALVTEQRYDLNLR